jgi:hypothetical protein
MRRGLLLLWAVLVAFAVVPSATATKPERELVPPPGDMLITGQCAFAVLAHIEGGEIDKTFFDREGNVVKQIGTFPGQSLTVTNLDTEQSITVTNAGSFHARAERDGSITISINGHGPLPNDIVGEPGLWYLDGGHVFVTLDEDGNPTSIVVRGNVVNLCDRLAPAG